MIAGIFYEGSGLGNQLHRYVATRVLALDKGYEFGMRHTELFKGKEFMKLDMGIEFSPFAYEMLDRVWYEKKAIEDGIDIRSYDPEINFVEDNTVIDGEFQDPRYFEHRLPEIREWLKVEPLDMPDDVCVINFRGGEYKAFPDLFLTKEYWDETIQIMKEKYPGIRFEVHTDDQITALQFFPDFPVIIGIGLNWRAIRYAKHLILSNSSFAILPALLNEDVKEVIAPRYWARHNTHVWAQPSNYYKGWKYI